MWLWFMNRIEANAWSRDYQWLEDQVRTTTSQAWRLTTERMVQIVKYDIELCAYGSWTMAGSLTIRVLWAWRQNSFTDSPRISISSPFMLLFALLHAFVNAAARTVWLQLAHCNVVIQVWEHSCVHTCIKKSLEWHHLLHMLLSLCLCMRRMV